MDKPIISIVLPIYNVEAYLERCLLSIKDQTFRHYEVLCINDGSTDDSQKVIDKFTSMDDRFRSYQKANGGLSDARNYGLNKCNGDLIVFIDSDDYIEPTLLERAYDRLIEDDLDIVIFDFFKVYLEDGHKEVNINPFKQEKVYTLSENPELLCFVHNAAWNKLYKKSLFIDNDIIYPYGYRHQDLGTTPKLIYLAKKIGFVNEPLYDYLADRPNNLTQQYDEKIYHIIDMNMEYLEYFKKNDIFTKYYEQLKYLCVINILNSLKKVVNFTDHAFVKRFIIDAFRFIYHYFPDYPSCIYELKQEKIDIIYLNKTLLLLYINYRKLKGKLK